VDFLPVRPTIFQDVRQYLIALYAVANLSLILCFSCAVQWKEM
jgi:hypothetical protein